MLLPVNPLLSLIIVPSNDAIAKTINPLMWAQKYKNGTVNVVKPVVSSASTTTTPSVTVTPSTPTSNANPMPTSGTNPIEAMREESEVTEGYVDFEIITSDTLH